MYHPVHCEIVKKTESEIKATALTQFATLITEGKLDSLSYDEPRTIASDIANVDIMLAESKKTATSCLPELYPEFHCVFVKGIPLSVKRVQIEEHFGKLEGFISLVMNAPHPLKNNTRYGYILFTTKEQAKNALSILSKDQVSNHCTYLIEARRV